MYMHMKNVYRSFFFFHRQTLQHLVPFLYRVPIYIHLRSHTQTELEQFY